MSPIGGEQTAKVASNIQVQLLDKLILKFVSHQCQQLTILIISPLRWTRLFLVHRDSVTAAAIYTV